MDTANPPGLKILLENIDRLRAEIDELRPLSPEQEARVMQKFRLDWNYHSNSIEGNSLTYGETIAFLMEGLTAKGKPFKDHLDIKGHNEGIDYLMEIIKNRQQLTEKTIRELHKTILVEPYKTPARTPDGQSVEKTVHLGQYKSLPNHVKTPTGQIHYYATPEETPAKMSDLMAWLKEHQEKGDLHPVMLAAIFHYRFVAIHPFDDGNGRMSRLLMNLLLMQYHFPPVVIKQQHRNDYYYALRQADGGDLLPFIEFIGENLVHSMEIYLRGARGESIEEMDDLDKEIALLKGSLEPEIKTKVIKSQKSVNSVLSQSIFPLFEGLYIDCLKLKELFLSATFKIDIHSTKQNQEIKITPNFKQFINNFNLRIRNKWPAISSIRFIVELDGFNRSKTPFNVRRAFPVVFDQFQYRLDTDKADNHFQIEKFYHEQLDQKEIKFLTDRFMREVIDYIKKQNGLGN